MSEESSGNENHQPHAGNLVHRRFTLGEVSDAGTAWSRSQSGHSRSGLPRLAIRHEVLHSLQEAVIVVGKDEKIELYNEAALELWGWPEDQVVGAHYTTLLGRAVDISPHGEAHQRLLTKREDGTELFLRISQSYLEVVNAENRTSTACRIIAENVADDPEFIQLHAVVEMSVNAIVSCTAEGEVSSFNKAASQMFGYPEVEALRKPFTVLCDVRAQEDSVSFLSRVQGKAGLEISCTKADGSKFPARMSVTKASCCGVTFFTAMINDITEEKQRLAQIQVEQRRTTAIMNSALNAIITTDASGRLELINASAGRVFGLHPQASIGTSLASLIVRGDGTCPAEEEMTTFLKTAAGSVQELVGQRVDGSRFPMRMSVSEVDEEGIHLFTAILRDVTKEKEAQARIEKSQEIIRLEKSKLAALLDSTVEGFLVVDQSGVIESFNKAAEAIFGYTADEVIGKNVTVLMTAKDAMHHGRHMRRHCEGGGSPGIVGHSREIKAKRKDGSDFRCLITLSETFVNGEHLFTATIRDLSSELLLMNMMPASIAARLRAKETIHDKHDNVSILFADIVGFTKLSSKLSPFEVVSFLNDIFQTFDDLVDTYQLEKIKTIGDCYMVVSGVPEYKDDHALRLGCFAIEMRDALLRYNKEKHPKYPLDMRIGLHCGPVIAGVVGKRKFLYDIWGDAVNVASRMESTGIAGAIQVSADFAAETRGWLELEDRGEIEVKGKGMMHTYILHGVQRSREVDLQNHFVKMKVKVDMSSKGARHSTGEDSPGMIRSKSYGGALSLPPLELDDDMSRTTLGSLSRFSDMEVAQDCSNAQQQHTPIGDDSEEKRPLYYLHNKLVKPAPSAQGKKAVMKKLSFHDRAFTSVKASQSVEHLLAPSRIENLGTKSRPALHQTQEADIAASISCGSGEAETSEKGSHHPNLIKSQPDVSEVECRSEGIVWTASSEDKKESFLKLFLGRGLPFLRFGKPRGSTSGEDAEVIYQTPRVRRGWHTESGRLSDHLSHPWSMPDLADRFHTTKQEKDPAFSSNSGIRLVKRSLFG